MLGIKLLELPSNLKTTYQVTFLIIKMININHKSLKYI